MGDVFVFAPLVFVYSIILGFIIGIIFDIFNNIAKIFNITSNSLIVVDIIFMLIVTLLTFIFVLSSNFGMLRWYVILGEIIGFSIYALTLMRFSKHIFNKLSKIYKNIVKNLKIVLKSKNKCVYNKGK